MLICFDIKYFLRKNVFNGKWLVFLCLVATLKMILRIFIFFNVWLIWNIVNILSRCNGGDDSSRGDSSDVESGMTVVMVAMMVVTTMVWGD